jgi:hypothetical protein
MQKYQKSVVSFFGGATPLVGASVTVTQSGINSTIYSDNGITVTANPLTTDTNGYFYFYAADGRYDITVTKTGVPTVYITDEL